MQSLQTVITLLSLISRIMLFINERMCCVLKCLYYPLGIQCKHVIQHTGNTEK